MNLTVVGKKLEIRRNKLKTEMLTDEEAADLEKEIEAFEAEQEKLLEERERLQAQRTTVVREEPKGPKGPRGPRLEVQACGCGRHLPLESLEGGKGKAPGPGAPQKRGRRKGARAHKGGQGAGTRATTESSRTATSLTTSRRTPTSTRS